MTDESPSPRRRRPAIPRRAPSGTVAVMQPGEQIRRTAIISIGIYWKSVAVFAFSILLLLLPLVYNLAIFFLIVAAVMFIVAFVTKMYLLLMLTDRRVVLRYGVLNLETVQLHYDKIESVELAWTPMGRLLGYATVLITGTGSRVTGIPFVANAIALRAEFDDLITARENKPMKVEITQPGSSG